MNQQQANKLNYIAKKQLLFGVLIGDPGWAKVWVEAEEPIAEIYRSEFYDELFSDDKEYVKSLEESLNWFGVRFV